VFIVRQARGSSVTELRLSGDELESCPRDRTAAAAQSTRERRMWGRVGKRRGRFRTRGRWSSGAVRGTVWLTLDRCDGTLTRVRSGTVVVREIARRRTAIVEAGERYLAPASR
jgi:hypothetical protein